jgi:hypothetical protein
VFLDFVFFHFYMFKELECERECSRGEDYRLIKLTITDFNVGAVCLLTFFLLYLDINICPLFKIYVFFLFFVFGKVQVRDDNKLPPFLLKIVTKSTCSLE